MLFRSSIHLSAEISSGVITKIDQFFFECIVSNLLDNALKYAGQNASINVELVTQDTFLLFTISDNGPGIPDAEKKMVFKKFYRSGNEETRSQKGSGLGLYIVSELVRLQKGTIQLSASTNGGAKFQVTLPL